MYASWRLRTSRALLALACGLALLAPGAAGQATSGADAQGSLEAVPTDGPGQAQVRDRGLGPLVTAGVRRDDRERPGPALPGVLAATLAMVGAWVSRRRGDRPARRAGAAAAGARAPPSLQPAPT